MTRWLRVAPLALLAACTAAPPLAWDLPAAERVVAVGDVHGNIDGLVAILKRAHLVDDDLRWSGGNSVLVQTGDLLDRGADVRAVLDLMARLQQEAPAAGGRVVVLWGNHEIVNLTVDLLDVAPAALASFEDERSPERRERALSAWRGSFAEPPDAQTEAEWHARHPAGVFAYVEAFGPRGRYGEWLRRQHLVARVGDSLFVHAGIHPDLTALSPAELNRRAREAVERIDRLRSSLVRLDVLEPAVRRSRVAAYVTRRFATLPLATQRESARRVDRALRELVELTEGGFLFAEETPTWFRGFGGWSSERLAYLPAYLDSLGVQRVVVGHMPQRSTEIGARLQGRVFLIDTAMQTLIYERGRPAALEITGATVRALYLDGEREL